MALQSFNPAVTTTTTTTTATVVQGRFLNSNRE
jgi:hypothetical protein